MRRIGVMRKTARQLLCGLLVLTLSGSATAGDSFTARIPAAIASGNYAEAEMLVAEAVKIGVITAVVAESYRNNIQQEKERSSVTQRSPRDKPGSDRSPTPFPDITEPKLDKDDATSQGRIYVTYTKFNSRTMRYYSGRTSMVINMGKSLRAQAEAAVAARDSNHHVDENDEPGDAAFRDAVIDEFDVGTAVDYGNRHRDVAYFRIRGREQQLIDFHGGAQSDTRKAGGPDRTENVRRAVARDHELGRRFHEAATGKWGLLARYTGD